MADYDLGTAHGRIVVDYDGKGIQSAEKSLDGLEKKSNSLLSRLGNLAKGWSIQSRGMGDDSDRLYQKFVRTGQGMTLVGVTIQALTGHLIAAGKGVKGLDDVAVALGKLPKGAERLPQVIQNVIRLSAAISVFGAGATLLGRALPHLSTASNVLALLTRHVPGIGLLSRGLASLVTHVPGLTALSRTLTGLGGAVTRLGTPFRVVAGAALGFLTVLSAFKIVSQYSKFLNTFYEATVGLGAGLHFTIQAIAAVIQSINDLAGAVALLPAIVGAAGLAFLTLKLGFSGFGAALKAIGKGDMNAFNKALKDMSPNARAAAVALKEAHDQLKTLKADVQQRLFAGVAEEIKSLAGLYLPLLQARLNAVATSFNRTAKEISSFFDNVDVANQFGAGLDDSARAVDNLLKAVQPLVEVLFTLWRVGSKVFADLTTNVGFAAGKFRDFVNEAERTGKLEAWMRRGVEAVGDLIQSIINLGRISKTIFDGLGMKTGRPFLTWLRQSTTELDAFLKSAEGQSALKQIGDWMDRSVEQFKKLADVILYTVLPALKPFFLFFENVSSMDAFIAALKVLAPLFKALGDALNFMAPVLVPVVNGIVFLSTILIGLGLALKIAGLAWSIFNTGLLVIKGITGAIRAVGLLTGQVGLFNAAAKLVKGGILAAGLMLVADGIDKVNVAAAGGDPEKLNDMDQTLHDLVTTWNEFWKAIETGDWSWWKQQIDDIKSEWQQLIDGFKKGEQGGSPIGSFLDTMRKRIEDWWNTTKQTFKDIKKGWDDFWAGFDQKSQSTNDGLTSGLATIGARIKGWWDTTKQTFSDIEAGLDKFWSGLGDGAGKVFDKAIENIKASWRDLTGFFENLPSTIGDIGKRLWDGFLLNLQITFQPVKDWFKKTPFEMGFAIGEGIGEFIKWGGQVWDNFKTGSMTKFAEYQTWLAGLLPSLGATIAGWAVQFGIWAGQVWDGFKTGTLTKWAEYQTWLAGLLPSLGATFAGWATQFSIWAGQVWEGFKTGTLTKWAEYQNWLSTILPSIGAALAGLGAMLGQIASDAWEQFRAWAKRKLDEAWTEVSSWPGRAGAALSSLPGIVGAKAQEAMESFRRWIETKGNEAIAFVQSIPGRILGALGNLGGLLVGAGQALMNGLLAGIKAAVQAVYDFVSGIAAGIAARKGPIPKDRKLLVPAGNAIVLGLVRGMEQSMPTLWRMINSINGDLSNVGGLANKVNLSGNGVAPTSVASLTAMPALPTGYPRGGDGGSSGDTFTIGQVTIPAKDIKEFRDVTDFFNSVQQKARAGRATR